MSFLTNLLADRLIEKIKTSTEPLGQDTLKAVAKLKDLGPGVIGPTLQALADADKNATVALVDVLSSMVSSKTFPLFIQGMVDGGPRIISGIAWALTGSRGYPANLLLEALSTKGVSKSVLLDVINTQRSRFTSRSAAPRSRPRRTPR